MTENAAQRCEYEDCEFPAVGYVEAQWTIADFVRYEACEVHMSAIRSRLSERILEGQGAVTWCTFYGHPCL